MQYQVYKESTGELVAWIDTESSEGITLSGYAIKSGEDLKCCETSDVTVADFEVVSFDTYYKGCVEQEVITSIPLLTKGVSDYYQNLKVPERSTEGSAGYDFITPVDLTIPAGKTIKIPTGIKVKMAQGYVLMMYPRSGLGFKYQLTMDNTVCVIDSDYYNNEGNEGHIFVKMTNHSDKDCVIPKGSAYCQGVFHRYYVTDSDYMTEKPKRVGGYGSTDKNRK